MRFVEMGGRKPGSSMRHYTALFRSLRIGEIGETKRGALMRKGEGLRAVVPVPDLHQHRSAAGPARLDELDDESLLDRKSTRLNSSHGYISYAVFCLKKKNRKITRLK